MASPYVCPFQPLVRSNHFGLCFSALVYSSAMTCSSMGLFFISSKKTFGSSCWSGLSLAAAAVALVVAATSAPDDSSLTVAAVALVVVASAAVATSAAAAEDDSSLSYSVASSPLDLQHNICLVCSSFPPSSPQSGGYSCSILYNMQPVFPPLTTSSLLLPLTLLTCTHPFPKSMMGAQLPRGSSLYCPPYGTVPGPSGQYASIRQGIIMFCRAQNRRDCS
mmetsp:Transcript_34154/g.60048  ORF Transcript_34154/g.60048 Transcript_34154/m.60048 type:complete len:221 (+) Transcript_34154:1119-1781(+)